MQEINTSFQKTPETSKRESKEAIISLLEQQHQEVLGESKARQNENSIGLFEQSELIIKEMLILFAKIVGQCRWVDENLLTKLHKIMGGQETKFDLSR